MNIQEAVTQLKDAGLCADTSIKTWSDQSEYIRGGESEETSGGITVWQGSFHIMPENGTYLVRVAGVRHPDPLTEEIVFDTLQEAVYWLICKKRIDLRA